MNRRNFIKQTSAISSALLMTPLLNGCLNKVVQKPNVVLIYADDLDFDEISPYKNFEYPCYTGMKENGIYVEQKDGWFAQNHKRLPRGEQGYYTTDVLTPHIEQLANEGAMLDRFYITTSTCTPSRYSLLTGRYASRAPSLLESFPANGPVNITWNTQLGSDETSIVREMKNNGYVAGFVGKWHNGTGDLRKRPKPKVKKNEKSKPELIDAALSSEELTFEQRAKRVELRRLSLGHMSLDADPYDPEVKAIMKQDHDLAVKHLVENIGFDYADRVYAENKEMMNAPKCMKVHNLDWITEGALEFIDNNAENPFFLYMPLTVPHGQYDSDWKKDNPLATPAGMLDKRPEVQPSREDILRRLDEKGLSHQTAMATWMDDSVGAVMNKLDKLNIADNTVVILTSDHQSRGKFTCHEGCRVPFIIRWPDQIKAGILVNSLYSNVDIAATLIEMAGGKLPEDMAIDGKSMLPSLVHQKAGRDSLLLEVGYTKAIISGDWKYIANRPPEKIMKIVQKEIDSKPDPLERSINWNGSMNWNNYEIGVIYGSNKDFPHYYDKDHLYNIKKDPFERANLVNDPKYADKLAELKQKMSDALLPLPHTFAEFKS